MKIIFLGSDDFAEIHLRALIDSVHQVIACVTQPDKPKDRGMKVVVSPIKKISMGKKIPVLQPSDLTDEAFIAALKAMGADIFVVVAYGRFLPDSLLHIPKFKAINVHGSLLPELRGAAPINWAIIRGKTQTGLTIFQITSQMDAGDILSQEKMTIEGDDTALSLRQRMMTRGPLLLLRTLEDIEQNKIFLNKQNVGQVTYAPKLTKEMGRIDWSLPAWEIRDLIRGLIPWPNAYTFFEEKNLKILSADVVPLEKKVSAGTVVEIDNVGFVVATGEEGLLVKEVHLQASRPMDAISFLNGQRISAGYTFPNKE